MRDIYVPENLFELAAQLYVDGGATFEQARDWVILQCLEGGEVSAFVYFETLGHQPGREVLRTLSVMMTENQHLSEEAKALAPFRLETKRRTGMSGRHDGPLITLRDQIYALNVKALMDKGVAYDAAVSEVAEIATEKLERGRSVKEETVRKAYNKYAASLKGN